MVYSGSNSENILRAKSDYKTCEAIKICLDSMGLGKVCLFENADNVNGIILTEYNEKHEERNSRYFSFPIRIGEFIDIVEKILTSRKQIKNNIIINTNIFILDLEQGVFTNNKSKTQTRLTEKEIGILKHLYDRQGNIVTKKELLSAVWDYAETTETHTIETHIYRLRQKIEIDPSNPKILCTNEKGYTICTSEE